MSLPARFFDNAFARSSHALLTQLGTERRQVKSASLTHNRGFSLCFDDNTTSPAGSSLPPHLSDAHLCLLADAESLGLHPLVDE